MIMKKRNKNSKLGLERIAKIRKYQQMIKIYLFSKIKVMIKMIRTKNLITKRN